MAIQKTYKEEEIERLIWRWVAEWRSVDNTDKTGVRDQVHAEITGTFEGYPDTEVENVLFRVTHEAPTLWTPSGEFIRLGEEQEDRWLVQDLLPEVGLIQMFGNARAGKSFLALDLAARIANDSEQTWYGKPILRHGRVGYVILEATNRFHLRLKAWRTGHPNGNLDRVSVVHHTVVDLTSLTSVYQLAAGASGADDVAMIVIDTQAKATVGADENVSKDMGNVVSNAYVLAEELGCVVLLIHHKGYAESGRGRGSSAQRAGMDGEIRVEKVGKRKGKFIVQELKDSEDPEDWQHYELIEAEGSLYVLDTDQRSADDKGAAMGEKLREKPDAADVEKVRNAFGAPGQALTLSAVAQAAFNNRGKSSKARAQKVFNGYPKEFVAKSDDTWKWLGK